MKRGRLHHKPQAKEDRLLSNWQCSQLECYKLFKTLVALTHLAGFKNAVKMIAHQRQAVSFGEACPASCTEAAGRRHRRVERWKTDEQRGRQGDFGGCPLHAQWRWRANKEERQNSSSQVGQKRWHTPAVSEHGHRFKSPNLRQDVG